MAVEKTLLIEIFQPFAQYRNPFTFYYAQTYPLPPKSTIIGMFQNATDKYYDDRFWNLKVSVHGGFESVFWNYQQLIKGDVTLAKYRGKVTLWNQNLPLYSRGIKSQRTPVYQQELFNGHLFIFIRGEADLIELIKLSLENPKKVLYLGRSEDVAFIRDAINIDTDERVEKKRRIAKKNIWFNYPTYIKLKNKNGKQFPIKNDKFPVYSIPIRVEFWNDNKRVRNKAELSDKTERKVKFETVVHTGLDYVVYLNKEVEVETFKLKKNNGKSLIFKIPVGFGWL